MKRTFAAVCLSIAAFVAVLPAKGPTTKIRITGADLRAPIEITDPAILNNFNVWAGPGAGSEGFIVRSAPTSLPSPPTTWHRYEVAFFSEQPEPIYVVSYQFDSSSPQGYVFLPGTVLNLRTFARGGIWDWWLPASRAWEQVVRPLIATAATR